jgi:uncharacterized protein (DUF697 family)
MTTDETVPLPDKTTQAAAVVGKYAKMAATAGVVQLPLFDLAASTGFQIAMVRKLADVYGHKFSEDRAKSVVTSLVGSLIAANAGYAALPFVKSVPLVGWAAGLATMPAFCYLATQALGKVFMAHFELGGTLLDFDFDAMKSHLREQVTNP